jgi:hypothetical protein
MEGINPILSWPSVAMHQDAPREGELDVLAWQYKGARVDAHSFVLELENVTLEVDNTAQQLTLNVTWAIDLPYSQRRYGYWLLHVSSGCVRGVGIGINGDGGSFSVEKPKVKAFSCDTVIERKHITHDDSHTVEYWHSRGELEDHGYSTYDYENGMHERSASSEVIKYKSVYRESDPRFAVVFDTDNILEVARWATRQLALRVPVSVVNWEADKNLNLKSDDRRGSVIKDDFDDLPF